MISVIICSNNDNRFAVVSKNLAGLLKDEPHEIIRISDARSLCEGYMRGIARSRGDYLIFCHDDIEVLTPDFAGRLKEYWGQFDLVGVAGARCMVRGEWFAAGPPFIFGQIAEIHPERGFLVRIFNVPGRSVGGIHAMDGVFIAAKRGVVEKVRFDAQTFDGFHLYDLDFTFAAHLAGFRLGIANDIHILHASPGLLDPVWRDYVGRFDRKYADRLQRITSRRHSSAWVQVFTKQDVIEIMTGNVAAAENLSGQTGGFGA